MASINKEKPRVLVVIPTLGQRIGYLRQTLSSISEQHSVAYDIVLIFPLKNKQTMSLARKFGAIIVDDPGGMSAAINAGIAKAKPWHEYICWLGDDDLLTPNSLKFTTEALDDNPKAVVAFGYCDYINSDGKVIFTSRAGSLAPWLMTWGPNLVPMMGLLLRRSALLQVGEFNIAYRWAMDLDMLLRLRKVGEFVNTKATLSKFRWHENSQTVSNRPRVLDEAEAIKRKYLPEPLRVVACLWEGPIRIATTIAAKRVNKKARRLT